MATSLRPPPYLFGGIGWHLLVRVLLFSSVVTLLLTLAQLYIDYQRDVSAIDVRMSEIDSGYRQSLGEGLWRLDTRQLQLQVDGIVRLPDVRYVELREVASGADALVISAGSRQVNPSRQRSFKIFHTSRNTQQLLGVLVVESTFDGIYRHLLDTAAAILVSQAIKTFVVAFFILFLVHRLITRHLVAIATSLGRYELAGLQEPLRLKRRPPKGTDELDRLVGAFHQMDARLQLAHHDLRLQAGLLQRLPVSAWTLERDGTPDFVNQVWLDFSGQTLEFIRSHPDAWMSAVHPDDRETATRSFWQGVHSGQGFSFETRSLRARDRTYRWHLQQAVVLRDDEGRVLKFIGTTTDIEDQKRTEEALRVRESNLLQITEAIPEMLWTATGDGVIDYCNGRFRDYTGLAADQLARHGWTNVLHPDDVILAEDTWKTCVRAGEPFRVEVRTFHAADRTHRWCVAKALPLLGPDGRVVKWHGTIVDLHDWRQAQDELRQTQAALAHVARVATLNALTASLAHEVNQPLSGILTNASTCVRMLGAAPPDVPGAVETALRTIRDANRATEVIRRLRAMFSKSPPTRDAVDLNEAAREVIALSADEVESKGALLRLAFAADLPPISANRTQLQQVILNLVLNAADAMLEVEDRPRTLLMATALNGDGSVELSVRDTGTGVDPHAVEKLFQAFYTTKTHGMGVGLSICRSIIENHEGRLWAVANDGPGATFGFCIPRAVQDPSYVDP